MLPIGSGARPRITTAVSPNIAIDVNDFTTGSIYAVVAYVWTFVTSSEYLPEQLESIASAKDIIRRLQADSRQESPHTPDINEHA